MAITLTSSPRIARTEDFAATLPGRVLLAAAATALVAAAAHVAIPLPFTPVPLTLQPLAVLLVGLALGPLDSFIAMAAYLAEGACGIPVFSPTGPGGLLQLLGPTGGFLLSYPVVAALCGGLTRLCRKHAIAFTAAIIGASLATALLFLCGAAWLAVEAHLDVRAVWFAAVAPFLPGEAVKVLIAAGIYRALSPANRVQL